MQTKETSRSIIIIFTYFIAILGLFTHCTPSIHLIDRQTVLELEASGDWQELDKKFQDKALTTGPLPSPNNRQQAARNKIFRMTHADSPGNNSTNTSQASNAKTTGGEVK